MQTGTCIVSTRKDTVDLSGGETLPCAHLQSSMYTHINVTKSRNCRHLIDALRVGLRVVYSAVTETACRRDTGTNRRGPRHRVCHQPSSPQGLRPISSRETKEGCAMMTTYPFSGFTTSPRAGSRHRYTRMTGPRFVSSVFGVDVLNASGKKKFK